MKIVLQLLHIKLTPGASLALDQGGPEAAGRRVMMLFRSFVGLADSLFRKLNSVVILWWWARGDAPNPRGY